MRNIEMYSPLKVPIELVKKIYETYVKMIDFCEDDNIKDLIEIFIKSSEAVEDFWQLEQSSYNEILIFGVHINSCQSTCVNILQRFKMCKTKTELRKILKEQVMYPGNAGNQMWFILTSLYVKNKSFSYGNSMFDIMNDVYLFMNEPFKIIEPSIVKSIIFKLKKLKTNTIEYLKKLWTLMGNNSSQLSILFASIGVLGTIITLVPLFI